MRVLLLIDHLGQGGAQRQMCILASHLQKQGMDVLVVVYHEDDFMENEFANANLRVEKVKTGGKYSKTIFLRKFIRHWQPNVLIAFLNTPSIIAELSAFPTRNFAVVVSERTGKVGKISRKDRVRLLLHRVFADAVVTNAMHLREFVVLNCPALSDRVHVIHNCVEVEKFQNIPSKPKGEIFEIVTVGRYRPEKNPFNLVEAMSKIRDMPTQPSIRLTWYGDNFFSNGKPTRFSNTFIKLEKEIQDRQLQEYFVLNMKTKNVTNVYQNNDAVCIASFYEGFSNVLGEAAASGKPLLASRVCDNPILAKEGQNGFLFNPKSSDEIADAFMKIARLSEPELKTMGHKSREIADDVLSPEKFGNSYTRLITSLAEKYRK